MLNFSRPLLIFLSGLMFIMIGCTPSTFMTYRLDPLITGTDCQSREECIRVLGLNNSVANPDMAFVVDPLVMNEKGKAPVGTPALNSPTLYGNVELCVAKALKDEFGNPLITFTSNSSLLPTAYIKLNKVVSQGVIPAKMYMRIDYEAAINNHFTAGIAKTDSEVFWSHNTQLPKQYPLVCKILASQLRELLLKEGVIKIKTEK